MKASIVLALFLTAGYASAQLGTSPSYRLEGLQLDGAGLGVCSGGFAGLIDQSSLASETLFSPTAIGEVGFLRLFDPLDTDQPSIFAVLPDSGPTAGGTLVRICGLHFDRSGLAAPVSVDVGGLPATGLFVGSDSLLAVNTPPGSFGPEDLSVTTALGTATREGGFVYSPAVVTSPEAWQGGELVVKNYGSPGALYQTVFSTNTTFIPLPFGVLLVGPTPLFDLIGSTPYPAPDGVDEVRIPLPVSPALAGATLHFQSVSITLVPLNIQLVNRSSTLFH